MPLVIQRSRPENFSPYSSFSSNSMDPDSPEGCGNGSGSSSSSSSSSRSRQRLKPWLEAQINSGRFPGLSWVDRSKGNFRITWKHGGRADWSEKDDLIFKEWAIHTGRYREGTDSPDWPSWKTRLRCALNKLPDIQELKDMSCYDEPNPFRVYKFVDRRAQHPNHCQRASGSCFGCTETGSMFQKLPPWRFLAPTNTTATYKPHTTRPPPPLAAPPPAATAAAATATATETLQ